MGERAGGFGEIEKKLTDVDINKTVGGSREMEENTEGIDGDGQSLDLGQRTHNPVYR